MEKQVSKSIIIEYQQLVENISLLRRFLTIETSLNHVLVGIHCAKIAYSLTNYSR